MLKPTCIPLALLLLTLSACGRTSTPSSPPASSSSVAESPAVATSSPEASPNLSLPAIAQTYSAKDGSFEISFPAGYQYRETGTGVAFVSEDKSFGGSVDHEPAPSGTITTAQLEASLKAEYEKRLKRVEWQGSEVQPDGSVRVDWVGTDQDNNKLDAISFIEQREAKVFILSLFAINKAYQDYYPHAEAIVGTYKIQP